MHISDPSVIPWLAQQEADNDCVDHYPSRGEQERIIARRDPVLHVEPAADKPLDQAELAAFRNDGFLVLDGIFSPSEISDIQTEQRKLALQKSLLKNPWAITEKTNDELRSLFQVTHYSDLLRSVASHPKIIAIVKQILGKDIYLYQSRLNYKPSFLGQGFYWHSDFETWHVEDGMPNMHALSVSIALTENTEINGPLMVIPASHHSFIACAGATPKNHFRESLKQQSYGTPSVTALEKLISKRQISPIYGKAGCITIFDCNLMHGSNSNISGQARSNAFFVYNSLDNRPNHPFSGQAPRPEFLCHREHIEVF